MAAEIGVIAEDQSDIDSLYEFARKIGADNSFKFRKFISHGCGKLRRKCRAWAENLRTRGCTFLVVVHDLDERDEKALRKELEALVSGVGFAKHVVVIPVRELEAWLLCDQDAIRTVFRLSAAVNLPHHPETLSDPKKELGVMIKAAGGTTYINTVHNRKLAAAASLERIVGRCPSFEPYMTFMTEIL